MAQQFNMSTPDGSDLSPAAQVLRRLREQQDEVRPLADQEHEQRIHELEQRQRQRGIRAYDREEPMKQEENELPVFLNFELVISSSSFYVYLYFAFQLFSA